MASAAPPRNFEGPEPIITLAEGRLDAVMAVKVARLKVVLALRTPKKGAGAGDRRRV